MKILLATALVILAINFERAYGQSTVSALSAPDSASKICVFWVVPDSQTGKPESVAYVYGKGGIYYCRMVLIYNESNNTVHETYLSPIQKAEGIPGNPYICGLDFIWGLAPNGSGQYSGSVINPDTGNVYNCLVWFDSKKDALAVRGQWFIFGQTQYWHAINNKKLPAQVVEGVKQFEPKAPDTSNSSWLF